MLYYYNYIYILCPQIQMHECAINCCKDPSNNVESLQACNEICSKQITAAQNHIQNQFNNWQVWFYLYYNKLFFLIRFIYFCYIQHPCRVTVQILLLF